MRPTPFHEGDEIRGRRLRDRRSLLLDADLHHDLHLINSGPGLPRTVNGTEEYDLTVRVFEALLPQFFEGASATYNDKRRRRPKAGATRNPVTGTLGLGAVSKSARGILLNTSSSAQEARFYALAKRKFWLIAGRVFGTGLLDARV